MKIRIIILLLMIGYNYCQSRLLISEIMPAPNGDEPEWIELFNSSNQTEIIDSIKISDLSKTVTLKNIEIKSGGYFIITSDSLELKKSRIIPDSSIIFQMTIPTLNNTTDALIIRYGDNFSDSLYYDMTWSTKGISLEREDFGVPAVSKENLKPSLDNTGATAGRQNSRKKIEIDTNYILTINEIMFDVSEGNAEYIELYNSSADTASLFMLKIWDATATGIQINEEKMLLNPKSYCVIAWDSSIFNRFPYLRNSGNVFVSANKLNLNNTGDAVVLKTATGRTLDSLYYFPNWHNPALDYTKDVSIEKINVELSSLSKSSWTSSTDILGGTPSFENSISKDVKIDKNLSAEPNPFSKSKSGKEYIQFLYKIPYLSALINMKIYDLNGSEVANPSNNVFSGKSGLIKWNGTDKNGYTLPVAAYIAKIEATDTETGSVFEDKILIVIAE